LLLRVRRETGLMQIKALAEGASSCLAGHAAIFSLGETVA
jgi:hypothetical protein